MHGRALHMSSVQFSPAFYETLRLSSGESEDRSECQVGQALAVQRGEQPAPGNPVVGYRSLGGVLGLGRNPVLGKGALQ